MAQIEARDSAALRTSFDARSVATYLAWVLAVAGFYLLFGKLGLSLAFTVRQVTAVWPPTGIALAALLLGGYRMWPGVFLGAFIANALSYEPPYAAAAIALGNTLGPLAGAYLLRRFDFDRSFKRVRDVLVFVLLGSIVAMTITATNGAAQLALAHLIPWSSYGPVWALWWMGDAAGVLLVAPVILTWSDALREGIRGEAGALEVAVIVITSFVSVAFEFLGRPLMAFPLYPFVVWAALRAGVRVTTALLVLTSSVALWGTAHHLGPFTALSLDARMTGFVVFTAVLSITALVLCALTSERRFAFAQMQAAERRFQVLAETLPQIVWTADAAGRIDWYNQRWHQYTGEEVLSSGLPDWEKLIAAGKPFERELLLRRADGVSRWFLVRAEPMRDDRGRLVRWYGTHTDIDDQRRALERSARIATTLQSAFLPASLPHHPRMQFDALYLTANQEVLIGGDWYDAFALADDRIVISIGDVTGHGLNAAVSAGRIRQSIVATAIDVPDPAEILSKVNRLLQFHDTTVATALVAIVDPGSLTLRYASAGHPSPIIAGPDTPAHSLPHGSLPLGVSRTPDYRTYGASLERDGLVVFYTDGISEFQRDIAKTERALFDAIDAVVTTSAQRPADAIRRSVLGDEEPGDDAVLLVLRIAPTDELKVVAEIAPRERWSFHSSHAYSAHNARHEVMNFIRQFAGGNQDLFTAELILGEILANTVEHAPGLVNVDVDWSSDSPIVTVVDTGPGLDRFVALLPDDELTEDGRGLYLVKTLARDVRVESDRGYGTKLTVTLPITR
ncbi:MAG TPA: MASE1 domain-containing protein [Candidatus Baltobacteraceae bacterium]|nr:MASE1 domain-containing protein [Candidatus Baltobacteraceae bacterium]